MVLLGIGYQRRHLPVRSPVLDYAVSRRNLVYDFIELKGSLWLSAPDANR